MIRFVKDGQVVFTEAENGELIFSDKALERSFTEKMNEVQPDPEDLLEGLMVTRASDPGRVLTDEERTAVKERLIQLQAKLEALNSAGK